VHDVGVPGTRFPVEGGYKDRGGGYVLVADHGLVDAARFERLVGAGQGALGLGEVAVAAGRFAEALALWRGRALADVTDVEPLALEAGRPGRRVAVAADRIRAARRLLPPAARSSTARWTAVEPPAYVPDDLF
jgi:Bacterial transcriptional activator domain